MSAMLWVLSMLMACCARRAVAGCKRKRNGECNSAGLQRVPACASGCASGIGGSPKTAWGQYTRDLAPQAPPNRAEPSPFVRGANPWDRCFKLKAGHGDHQAFWRRR